MRPAHSLARIAALGLLAGAAVFAAPAAVQESARTPRQIVTVGGRRATSGEVLVKFRRQLASFERGQLDQQTDADENQTVGSAGVRRLHSRRYDTATLLAFLRSHPDVARRHHADLLEVESAP